MTMRSIPTQLILTALALCSLLVGCGGGRFCDAPPPADLALVVAPQAVPAGSPETVVVSFERAVFTDGEFRVHDWGVTIFDRPDGNWLGTYDDSLYSMDHGNGPYVTGVILSGEVIDDRSIEIVVEFPAETAAGSYPIRMFASNGGVECYTDAGGESVIEVGTAAD